MTVIRPNSISGVSSITGSGGDISIFRADGTAADVTVNNITSGIITATTFKGAVEGNITGNLSGGTINATSGTITGNLGVGGVLTYEDVANIDSVGVITARSGINVTSGSIGINTTGGNEKLNAFGAIRSSGSSANFNAGLEGTLLDYDIANRVSRVGHVNGASGSARSLAFLTGGGERLRVGPAGQLGIGGANYGTSGQVLTSQGSGSAVQWASPSLGLEMADQWRVSTSQTTSSDTIADITGWSRNNNNFAGVGSALTNSGANFTFPSTGIYYISYNITTYITTGSARYISARLYFAGQDICHSWESAYHASGNQTTQSTGSQAIINVTNTATQTFKIRIQSQNPVVVVGLNEAGYNSSVNMSEVVVMKIG